MPVLATSNCWYTIYCAGEPQCRKLAYSGHWCACFAPTASDLVRTVDDSGVCGGVATFLPVTSRSSSLNVFVSNFRQHASFLDSLCGGGDLPSRPITRYARTWHVYLGSSSINIIWLLLTKFRKGSELRLKNLKTFSCNPNILLTFPLSLPTLGQFGK